MATKKSTTKRAPKAATVAPPPPTASIQEATKTIQAAVDRAIKARQLTPKIRGPIFVGIWYNPITKKFEVVNQFE